jgi:hypothetical protein
MARPHLISPARHLHYALSASLVLHTGLLSVLVADAAWPFLFRSPPAMTASNLVVLEARTGPRSAESDDTNAAAEVKAPAENSLAEAEAGRPPEQVFGDRVAASLEKAAAAAQTKSTEENQQQLEELTGKLGRISSEKSVDEMAGKFRQWFGTQQRAERPAQQPVAGEFDYLTAQLHDVRREPLPDAGYVYIAILVDAAGRRVESRMDEGEGESAYKTMQLVKSNPLAELVYRRIVMGFLDNVIKAAKAAEEGAQEIPAANKSQAAAP